MVGNKYFGVTACSIVKGVGIFFKIICYKNFGSVYDAFKTGRLKQGDRLFSCSPIRKNWSSVVTVDICGPGFHVGKDSNGKDIYEIALSPFFDKTISSEFLVGYNHMDKFYNLVKDYAESEENYDNAF